MIPSVARYRRNNCGLHIHCGDLQFQAAERDESTALAASPVHHGLPGSGTIATGRDALYHGKRESREDDVVEHGRNRPVPGIPEDSRQRGVTSAQSKT
jgi:hypothetical protein